MERARASRGSHIITLSICNMYVVANIKVNDITVGWRAVVMLLRAITAKIDTIMGSVEEEIAINLNLITYIVNINGFTGIKFLRFNGAHSQQRKNGTVYATTMTGDRKSIPTANV